MADDTISSSAATDGLAKAGKALKATDDLLARAHLPMQGLVTLISEFDGYITDANKFLSFIDDILKILHETLQISKYLGELIPEVGPIIADAASVIESTQIEQTAEKVVRELKDLLKEVQNGAVKEIKASASTISSHLEGVLDQLPSWGDTIGILEDLSTLIDIAIGVFFSGSSDELVKKTIESLNNMAFGILGKLKVIETDLQPVKDFIETIWEKFKNAVVKPLQNGFGAIIDALRPFMGIVTGCLNACKQVEAWFEPFYWVLHAIQWIFEHTVGWLIDKVMNELGLHSLIDKFVERIKEGLGIAFIEAEMKDLLGSTLNLARDKLNEIKIDAIENSVKEFTQDLKAYRKDPAGQLIEIVWKGLIGTDLTKLRRRFDDPDGQNDTGPFGVRSGSLLVAPPPHFAAEATGLASNSGALTAHGSGGGEVGKVTTLQLKMDDFVEKARGGLRLTVPGAPQAGPVSAPKLGYALYDSQPVSVLMRIAHKQVLLQQLDARTKPLPLMTTAPAAQPVQPPIHFSLPAAESVSVSTPSASPSGGELPNFDVYLGKYTSLLDEVKSATIYLTKMEAAAKQADADFAAYSPNAVDFCDHFVSMLDGIDPILDASIKLLDLPIHYHTALTQDLVKAIKDNGLPDDVADITIPLLFTTIEKVVAAIETFRKHKNEVWENSKKVSVAYHTFHDHVAQVCSSDRFPKTLGSSVRDFTSLITVLKQRLSSLANSFTFVKNLGETILTNKDQLQGDTKDVFAKLDAIYASLVPVVDSTIAEMQSFPHQVDKLYAALVALHEDVRVFFNATHIISEQCRVVEAKVIAADRVRRYCNRINDAVGPLESLLTRLSVHADSPDGSTPTAPVKLLDAATGRGKEVHKFMKPFIDLLSGSLFAGISVLLDHFFELSVVGSEMNKLGEMLQKPLDSHLTSFDTTLRQLVNLVEPKKTNIYTVPPNVAGGTPGHSFLIFNPLLDDKTAQTLGTLLQEIIIIAHGVVYKDGDPILPNSIRVPKWASPGVDEKPIKDLYLLTWGRVWDEAEPTHPSQIFTSWYNLLERLDRLMQRRQAWQRVDTHAPPPQPPAGLTGSGLEFWKVLEEKAIVGGSQYEPGIVKPLQKPLHDRIDQLFMGTVQLPPESASNDILKLLPPPKEGQFPPLYTLPLPAVDLVSSAFPNKVIPKPLSQVLADQDRFEHVVVNLRPFLSAAESIYTAAGIPTDAGISALAGIHGDYNLMDARKLLELTTDEAKAREFVKLAGSEERLK